jgi:hypothetical protein
MRNWIGRHLRHLRARPRHRISKLIVDPALLLEYLGLSAGDGGSVGIRCAGLCQRSIGIAEGRYRAIQVHLRACERVLVESGGGKLAVHGGVLAADERRRLCVLVIGTTWAATIGEDLMPFAGLPRTPLYAEGVLARGVPQMPSHHAR